MLVGYMRVSSESDRQTTDLQRDALLATGVDARHLFEDHASGAKDDRAGVGKGAGVRAPGRRTRRLEAGSVGQIAVAFAIHRERAERKPVRLPFAHRAFHVRDGGWFEILLRRVQHLVFRLLENVESRYCRLEPVG
jgi:hypothetical protein